MSGIVALLDKRGAPLDRALVERLTDELGFRGPDGRGTWTDGPVGLGHTLLRTTPETGPSQPLTVDGRVWVTGDVRIDARAELVAELARHVRSDLTRASDAELLLHAYSAWGDRCPDHLMGDFAFVVWDVVQRTLFAARDPLGVKLLYYADTTSALVLSNTLRCVRAHPRVGTELDDVAVGDFLLFGGIQESERVTFKDVRCVPAGHTLTWSADSGIRLRRYWQLPTEAESAPYSDDPGYVDEFATLLDVAVSDRLRTDRVGIWMSGGLDSSLIAAMARGRLGKEGHGISLRAVTYVYDCLDSDQERHYSSVVADALGVPTRHFAVDHFDQRWDWMRQVAGPEPATHVAKGPLAPGLAELGSHSRVALTGRDGDALLVCSLARHWKQRIRRGELGTVGRELGWFLRSQRLPRIGFRSALRSLLRRPQPEDTNAPAWLNSHFVKQTGLLDRYRSFMSAAASPSPRGKAYLWLSSPVWRGLLDDHDPGTSEVLLEHRHPMADVRLIRFALSLPVVPWCPDKELIRSLVRRVLPAEIAERPKEARDESGMMAAAARDNVELLRSGGLAEEIHNYVRVDQLVSLCQSLPDGAGYERSEVLGSYRTHALNAWLLSPQRR